MVLQEVPNSNFDSVKRTLRGLDLELTRQFTVGSSGAKDIVKGRFRGREVVSSGALESAVEK
jgi:hypothetical protein